MGFDSGFLFDYNGFILIAGPCSAESEEQLIKTATILKPLGIKALRASVFKPRTSPHDFQGLGKQGLTLLKRVREKTGLLMATEVMDARDAQEAAEYADILWVGARNMQHFALLKELGKVNRPVILKRGMSATIREFLLAAEYITSHGNRQVILCERGIRTFETAYKNTLDLGSVAIIKKESKLRIIVDPSHAAGRRDIIEDLSKAAIAAGADGLMIEMHPDPESALSDREQSLYPDQLGKLVNDIKPFLKMMGKKL